MVELKSKPEKNVAKNATGIAYASLIFVVFVWGCAPNVYDVLFEYFSPSMCPAIIGLSSAITLLLISLKELKYIDKRYFLLAVPTGLFNGAASIMQKIGLQYTTPAQYAFLENLSCIVVPFLMLLFVKKKPNAFKLIACALCLAGAFVLNFDGGEFSFGIGAILCALAGILYGVNIAMTGAFATNLNAPIYVMIQMFVTSIISFATSFGLNAITVNGAPIEQLKFTWSFLPIAGLILFGLLTNAFCWIVRTSAMKHIDATVVAVIMPFSAVITAVVSVIFGQDTLSLNLIFGGLLCLMAAILSGFADTIDVRKHKIRTMLK